MEKDTISFEIFKWILTIITLFITWGIGQQILAYWDEKKKRREFDISTTHQFQQLYGEFKTIWRLWRAYHFNVANNSDDTKRLPPPETNYCWELLDRAAKAEGNVEGILVKIATERYLDEKNSRDLGLFRQAYQQLRQSIRDNKSESFQRDSPEYYLFDELACEFLRILSFNKTMLKKDYSRVSEQNHAIKDIGSNDWKEAVEKRNELLQIEYTQEEAKRLQNATYETIEE